MACSLHLDNLQQDNLSCYIVLRKWKHTDSHSVILIARWFPLQSEREVAQLCLTLCDPMDCSQKDKVNDVPRLNPQRYAGKTKQTNVIPKSGNPEIWMEILKTVIGGGGLERLHFVYTNVFHGECCKQGVTTALSHAGKFRLGVRNINWKFDIIGCANSFPSIPEIILFWKGA